jgi:anionic cell wall polymer biosynthesis LytR-Cps2A-Psr (LCP) family protein
MKIGNKDYVFKFEYKKPKIWQIILGILAFFLISLIAFFGYYYFKANKMIKTFSNAAELPKEKVLNSISSWLNNFQNNYQNLESLDKKTSFLIMGTDKVDGRGDVPELTDSILLLTLNTETNQINTISLPRDLYNEPYQTRINALYYYGNERYPETPQQFPEETLEEMLGIEIDHTIIVRIADLEELINIIGGIDLTVPVAFTDPEFPRSGVDVTVETDPAILYEEISFEVGVQKMDGATALKYMRSRHSENDEGTDNARSKRQQLVLETLASEIKNIRNPEILGKLYRFYLDNFEKYLTVDEAIEILTPLYETFIKSEDFEIKFKNNQLSVYPQEENGVIYNPPTWQTQGEWIYQIKDQEKFLEVFANL